MPTDPEPAYVPRAYMTPDENQQLVALWADVPELKSISGMSWDGDGWWSSKKKNYIDGHVAALARDAITEWLMTKLDNVTIDTKNDQHQVLSDDERFRLVGDIKSTRLLALIAAARFIPAHFGCSGPRIQCPNCGYRFEEPCQ